MMGGFWAPWCGPGCVIAPITEKLAKEYAGRLKFCKLKVDENPPDGFEVPGLEHSTNFVLQGWAGSW